MSDTPVLSTLPLALAKRYRPRQILGTGGMGVAILAEDPQLDRLVVIKLGKDAKNPRLLARARREGQVLARLQHRNIVQVYDAGVSDQGSYLVMERVLGVPLHRAGRGVRWANVFAQLGAGMQAVHRVGLLHRDVKPQNVLLEDSGRVVLIDFGLVRDPSLTPLTASGHAVGTWAYMAPECYEGAVATEAADWFSWGACLFTCLEKRVVYKLPQVLQYIGQGTPLALEFDSVQTPRLQEFFRAVLHPDPSSRLCGEQALAALAGLAGEPLLGAAEKAPARHRTETLLKPARLPPARNQPRAQRTSGASQRKWPVRLGWVLTLAFVVAATLRPWDRGPVRKAGAAAGSEARDAAGGVAERWGQRLRFFEIARAVQDLHARVYGVPPDDLETYSPRHRFPGGERHQLSMIRRRLRIAESSSAISAAMPIESELQRSREGLPWRTEFAEDREALEGLLKATGPGQRHARRLARDLAKLAQLDAYFAAWGEPEPYGAQSLLDTWVSARWSSRESDVLFQEKWDLDVLSLKTTPSQTAAVERVVASLEPGEHTLYRWGPGLKRRIPLLVQDPSSLSHMQAVLLGVSSAIRLNFSRGTAQVYGPHSFEVELGETPARDLSRVRLELQLGNLAAPDAFRLEVNGFRFLLFPPWHLVQHARYQVRTGPEYQVVLTPPASAWRTGKNVVRIGLVSLPGLNHRQAADVWSVRLLADPAQ